MVMATRRFLCLPTLKTNPNRAINIIRINFRFFLATIPFGFFLNFKSPLFTLLSNHKPPNQHRTKMSIRPTPSNQHKKINLSIQCPHPNKHKKIN